MGTGAMASDTSAFSNTAMSGVNCSHSDASASVFGAGHLNALMNANHFFTMWQLKTECAAFSIIKKRSVNSFEFVGNSTINGMGSFLGWDRRELPDLWQATIAANLDSLIRLGRPKRARFTLPFMHGTHRR